MIKYIVLSILILASSVLSSDFSEYCYQLAETVMTMRQNELSPSEIISKIDSVTEVDGGDLLDKLVFLAFLEPIGDTEYDTNRTIREFAEKLYIQCGRVK